MLIGDPLLTRILTGRNAIGKPRELIVDEVVFGGTIRGEESQANQSYFTRTTSEDNEKMYSLGVLCVWRITRYSIKRKYKMNSWKTFKER